ncbi:MAG: 4-(cytidine 5'-diphospho)-2-C-methyl-D-erythritol kinase [Candidatus Omnitrophica bacterium]|nr:4-(cytidine 5'-diphospho)-2-C-methyl-D-erythritol kinase [Candidatus Omnitrophota bacterium]
MKVLAPAKINLFLKVGPRRPDGYHDIETLFERVSLCDQITLSPARSGIRFSCDDPSLPGDERNLAWKAAALVQKRLGISKGISIHLKKRIPAAAGLGGGSSDAAAVLLGLNRLWRLRLSPNQLGRLALTLGSDVPFFVRGVSRAIGRGRGEKLCVISSPRLKIWLCLVKPPFEISTREAYEGLGPSSLTPQKSDVKMLLHSIQKGDAKAVSALLTNSLEHSLNKRVTAISKIKKRLLEEGALGSLLSGSGSTVFGVFRSRKEAEKAARVLKRNRQWKVWVVSTY